MSANLVNGNGGGVTDAPAFRAAIGVGTFGGETESSQRSAVLTALGVTSYADNSAAVSAIGAGRIYFDLAVGYLAISA